MTIIDGRNPNTVTSTLNQKQFEALLPERLRSYSPEWKTRTLVHIYRMGDRFVPVVQRDGTLILCAEYKTERGAHNWVTRNFEHAVRID